MPWDSPLHRHDIEGCSNDGAHGVHGTMGGASRLAKGQLPHARSHSRKTLEWRSGGLTPQPLRLVPSTRAELAIGTVPVEGLEDGAGS